MKKHPHGTISHEMTNLNDNQRRLKAVNENVEQGSRIKGIAKESQNNCYTDGSPYTLKSPEHL